MTATAMDSFDAQMLDYPNDNDVQMQISSSDPWFQDVTPMEDDAHLTFQPKAGNTDTTPTVEVDMEAYVDDEHIEYEMVDDHHSHNPTSSELLDVDVLPASAVQSPFVTVTSLPITPSIEYPQPPTHLAPTSDSASLISKHVTESSTVVDSALDNPGTVSAPQADAPLPVIEQPSDIVVFPEPVSLRTSGNTEQPPAIQPPAEVLIEQPDSAEPGSVRAQSETEEIGAHDPTVYAETGNPHHTDSGTQPESTIPTPHNDTVGSQAPAEQVEEHFSDATTQGSCVDTTEPVTEQGPLIKPTPPQELEELSTEAVEHTPQETTAHSVDESAEAASEVSEELYLEVPPPILLAIFSVDHPELCLFNKPLEPLPTEDDTQERHILLQTAPSLYYEPLVHIFEALRQDEYVSTVLEITGNELALEAYEFDLAITEDNFYAREISLHDIHALHTSANLAGPLRLRLYISGSRFIVRYHMLQEGLNLHVEESQSSGHDETDQSQLDKQDGKNTDAQDDISGAGGDLFSEQVRFDTSEGSEDQPEEEEHEQYFETPHGGAGEIAEHSGEIDLSTLPPFVDSPEAHDEGGEEKSEESIRTAHLVTTTPDNPATGDTHTQDEDRECDELVGKEELDQIGFEVSPSIQKQPSQNEEISSDSRQHHGKEIGADPEAKRNEESLETRHDTDEGDEIEEHNHTSAQEHTEEIPQSEQIESTNEEPLFLEPTDENQHEEDASIDQYENARSDVNEVNKDFETELGETWDDELDGEGDPDTTWEAEQENVDESISNESSVTLSSKASKRSFDEFGLEHSDDENIPESPGAKRARVE